MKVTFIFPASLLAATLLFGACAKEPDNVVDETVEKTKDALDVRDHEKLKDAAEEAKEAAKDAAEGVKDAAEDAKPKSN